MRRQKALHCYINTMLCLDIPNLHVAMRMCKCSIYNLRPTFQPSSCDQLMYRNSIEGISFLGYYEVKNHGVTIPIIQINNSIQHSYYSTF